MEKRFLFEFRGNVAFIDRVLRPIYQGFLNPNRPTSLCGWFLRIYPILYIAVLISIYFYLIFVHGQQAGLALVAQQLWTMMALAQAVSKLINAMFRVKMLQDLLRWCEECYTMEYRPKYVPLVNEVFRRTNIYPRIGMRLMAALVLGAGVFYTVKPMLMRVRETPTVVSMNGNDYWPDQMFILIYACQVCQSVCVSCALAAYDGVFLQITMSLTYRFSTMKELLSLLDYSGERNDAKDRQILVDVYKMHSSVLEATERFRSFFFFYGLVQLGTIVFCNCANLFILQTIGFDMKCAAVLGFFTAQVFGVSYIGQMLQDEASKFGDALYETDWMAMSPENKKRLLLLMIGCSRVVNIRAGGTYELNLGLFARVMKAGISLCAVMKAM